MSSKCIRDTVLIGEGIAGSHQEFVKMMNEKAKQLKLVNTHFKNCTGLHDVEHYTRSEEHTSELQSHA